MMICIPIQKKTSAEIIKALAEAQKEGDLVEIWFDELIDKTTGDDVKKIFKNKKKPFIYKSSGDLTRLKKFLNYKVEYVDLDVGSPKKLIAEVKNISPKTKLILSFHDFKKTPDEKELSAIVKKMTKQGADICKLATTAKTLGDSIKMLSFLSKLRAGNIKAICVCMGKEGLITRTTGHLFGNYLMYAPLDTREKTAKGQVAVKQLKEIICLLK